MEEIVQFLAHYGYVVLFAWVLAEQIGLPLPAAPVLLAAGALAGRGLFHLSATLTVAVCACLLSDLFWFRLGQRGGSKVLSFVCRISLEPDSCVRRTNNLIGKYGPKGLLVTKFIPGMTALAAPLAGSGGISLPRFLVFDLLGSLLWSGSFLGMGLLVPRTAGGPCFIAGPLQVAAGVGVAFGHSCGLPRVQVPAAAKVYP